jgi:hypothetical protein
MVKPPTGRLQFFVAWRNGHLVEAWRNERVVFERPLGSSAPQMRGVAGPNGKADGSVDTKTDRKPPFSIGKSRN